MVPTDSQVDAFYRSAALGLAWLDAREPEARRFGAAAAASWRNYAAQPAVLTELDRLELLLRDAATLHPAAFGARAVFSLEGLTEDEPFGPWLHAPAAGLARDTLRAPPAPGASARALLEAAARAWAEPVGAVGPLPSIGPTTRVLCAGVGALLAVVAHAEANRELDVAEQVLVVSDRPALRQLAGLAGVALGARTAPRTYPPALAATALRAAGVTRIDALVSSDDATTEERVAAEAWLDAFAR